MYNPDEDGITHINAYSKGKTQTGRFLSNFAHFEFECKDGKFASIEGYWYWLGADHPDKDKLRIVSGYTAKKIGRELKSKDWPTDPDFKEKILKACWQKVKQNFIVSHRLRESTLPIVHYYSYGSPPKVVVPKEGKWIWDWYEKAREYLKKHPEV